MIATRALMDYLNKAIDSKQPGSGVVITDRAAHTLLGAVEQLDRLQQAQSVALDMMKRDVWVFQGDGHDHIESMGEQMTVAIRAGQLRTLLGKREEEETK